MQPLRSRLVRKSLARAGPCLLRQAALIRHAPPRLVCAAGHARFQSTEAALGRTSEPIPPSSLSSTSQRPQTLTEKIFQRYSVGLPPGKLIHSGDYVTLAPHHCMSHDNTWPIANKFFSIGAKKIHNKEQIVITLDHDVQNKSEQNLKKYRQIEEFATIHGIKEIGNFYPAGRGIGHQIIVEEGYALPGTLVVASDSHSPMYGGVGSLGLAVVRTDAASIWATGQTWLKIPPVTSVRFTGTLPAGVTGKDVIVALCGLFNNDEVLNHAVEYTGSEETLRSLPIDDRLAIANMTTEFGGLSGLFPVDSVLEEWLRAKTTAATARETHQRAQEPRFSFPKLEAIFKNKPTADPGAKYAQQLYLNLSTLSPYVSGPNSVKVATPLHELAEQQIRVDRAYLVSCTNARASDFAAAAKVFRDAAKEGEPTPKIADHVNFYIAAASKPEQKAMEAAGDWQVLLDAGAQALPSGCGPCIGMGLGLLQPGENGISASNRNFKGRMGSTEAHAYLASPEVVAASALSGHISGPGKYQLSEDWDGVELGMGNGSKEEDHATNIDNTLEKMIGQLDETIATGEREYGEEPEPAPQDDELVELFPGFPETISGEIVFIDEDHVNTDAIYPARMTYQDDVTPEQMAAACMENYDPEFPSIVKESDILVSGYNFGCGSSREQAATSILASKIPMVVAGSFGTIFSRNSINNALMGLEVPHLVERLRQRFPSGKSAASNGSADAADEPSKVLTRRTGWLLTWDVRRSRIAVSEGEDGPTWAAPVKELPANVQEIIAKGGLEKWVRAKIEAEN